MISTPQILPPDADQDYIEVTKEMARVGTYRLSHIHAPNLNLPLSSPSPPPLPQLHHGLQDTSHAIALLQGILRSHRSHMDAESINLLAELCSVSGRYQEAFRVSGWVSG